MAETATSNQSSALFVQFPAPKASWFSVTNAADVASISIHDEISAFGVTHKDFALELSAITAPVINLSLNSPGGLVDDGVAIYNALRAHPATVNVHIPAIAASIATVIAMAGDTITIAPHARLMVHEAMSMGMGFASDFEKVATRLRATTETIASIYAERTGRDVAYWLALMAEETWFGDQEAVDAGLADRIGLDTNLAAFKIAANFNLSQFRASNIAEELLAVAEEKRPDDEDAEEEDEAETSDVPPTEEPAEDPAAEDEPITTMSYREIRKQRVDVELEALLGVTR